MKSKLSLFTIIALIICILTACKSTPLASQNQVPSEIENLYTAYLDAAKTDRSAADQKYCHYEIEKYIALDMQDKANIIDYTIQNWKQLNENLWVVQSFIKTPYEPEGYEIAQYVGNIDGTYYVMKREFHIPSSLKQGLDLTEYIPTGDDILG